MVSKGLLFFIIFLLSLPVFALTDSERAVLVRAKAELNVFLQVIEEAEQAANPQDKKQVNYQVLRDDIKKIKEGISDVIESTRREPRSLPPVTGEYQ